MSYVKTTWSNGDVITAAKLNNMETGIEDANNASAPTYSISIASNIITLTGSDGTTSTVTLPVYNGGLS